MTKNKIIFYNPDLKEKARRLRINCTPSETLLWSKIRRKSFGYEFHRQVPIDEYIVDFFCHELRLAIEVDGSSHINKYKYDLRRQKKLESFGVRFVRFEDDDVTAWSLPLLFNVEAVANNAVAQGNFEIAKPVLVLPGELHEANATVAFLAPWGSEAAGRLLAAALRQDLKVFSSDKPFPQGATKFPAGTLIFKVAGNPADLGERLARLARESGADVYGTNSGWVDEGVNFGSRYVLPVRKPAIALAWDTPASSSSAGAVRFVLERQFGYPVTPIRTAQLNSVELAKFQVLILPDGGGYAGLLGDAGIQRVKAWVQAGGVIVALGGAVGFLTDSRVGLLDIVQENVVRDTDEKKPEAGRGGSAGAA